MLLMQRPDAGTFRSSTQKRSSWAIIDGGGAKFWIHNIQNDLPFLQTCHKWQLEAIKGASLISHVGPCITPPYHTTSTLTLWMHNPASCSINESMKATWLEVDSSGIKNSWQHFIILSFIVPEVKFIFLKWHPLLHVVHRSLLGLWAAGFPAYTGCKTFWIKSSRFSRNTKHLPVRFWCLQTDYIWKMLMPFSSFQQKKFLFYQPLVWHVIFDLWLKKVWFFFCLFGFLTFDMQLYVGQFQFCPFISDGAGVVATISHLGFSQREAEV